MTIAVAGALVVGILWRLGAPPEVGLEIAEAPDTASASSVQLMGAPGMRSEGSLVAWVHPAWEASNVIPVDAAVIQSANGPTVLVARVLAEGESVTVTEQKGRLPAGFSSEFPMGGATGHEVFVVSEEEPAQVVWDAGGVVVGLACDCTVDVLESVASEFPNGNEPGVLERLGDGLRAVADAVTGG